MDEIHTHLAAAETTELHPHVVVSYHENGHDILIALLAQYCQTTVWIHMVMGDLALLIVEHRNS
jgi:hypothetical protein